MKKSLITLFIIVFFLYIFFFHRRYINIFRRGSRIFLWWMFRGVIMEDISPVSEIIFLIFCSSIMDIFRTLDDLFFLLLVMCSKRLQWDRGECFSSQTPPALNPPPVCMNENIGWSRRQPTTPLARQRDPRRRRDRGRRRRVRNKQSPITLSKFYFTKHVEHARVTRRDNCH